MRALIGLLVVQALASATPLVLAGLGELVAERAGVINIGIEGLIAVGTLAGATGAACSGHAWIGVASGAAAGMALAAVFALVTVWARVDQIVAGMAINLLALGAIGTAWQGLQDHGRDATLPAGAGFVAHAGVYGLTVVTAVLAIGVAMVLVTTRAGIIVTALGEEPDAAAAAGVRVRAWRTTLVLLAGAAAGIAGTFYTTMRVQAYEPGASAGAGFLVLALVIFGRWRVDGLVAGCLLFGLIDAEQSHLQAAGGNAHVPHQLLQMLPYLAALMALAVRRHGQTGPAQLGVPWPRRA